MLYIIRCVESGCFNYDMLIRKGEFITSLGGSTKNLQNAVTFDTKMETKWMKSDITNKGETFIFPKNKMAQPARFEIVAVELTIKE